MGAETNCAVTFGKKTSSGKVRLETATVQIRTDDVKLDLPFTAMKKVVARDGVLSITHKGGTLSLALGDGASKWAEKILNPPSRLAKLGVKSAWSASVVGPVEAEFLDELKAAVATLSVGRVSKNADAIFFGVVRLADLERLDRLKRALKPNGALWIIRQKGHAEITERGVMAAGKAAGLVDVKVVAFSATHTAEKFVIPVKNRPSADS
jgi:hypothetical protein